MDSAWLFSEGWQACDLVPLGTTGYNKLRLMGVLGDFAPLTLKKFLKLDIAMKTQLTSLQLISFFAVFATMLSMGGCKTGLDVDALPLDPSQVINYGADVTAGRAAVEAVAYGQLAPGSSEERSGQVLQGEMKDIVRCIERLKDFPKNNALGAQEGNYNSWTTRLQSKFSALSPVIEQARTSTGSAQTLATTMEAMVKTGGDLETLFKDGERFVPAEAKTAFTGLTKSCSSEFDRIYQIAIVMAQTLTEKDAIDKLSKVEGALARLRDTASTIEVFTKEADNDSALAALTVADTRVQTARTLIDSITSRSKVGTLLDDAVVDLQAKVNLLNADYVAKADPAMKADAKTEFDSAVAAGKELEKVVKDYVTGAESLKSTNPDPRLNDLVTKAFNENIAILLGDFSLGSETQINRLTTLLGSSSVVVLQQDSSSKLIVESMASSVVSGVAAKYGLPDVTGVFGLSDYEVIKAKNELGISKEGFANYCR